MNWMFYLKTTETCNLNCKHCFTSGVNGAKIYWDYQQVIQWVSSFIKHKVQQQDSVHCDFFGGEPFLADLSQLREVVRVIKSIHPDTTFGITSNLVLKLTDQHLAFIETDLDNRIGTSWDPTIRFENDKQQALWLKNVKTLIGQGTTIRLHISVTKDTVAIDPIMLLSWLKELGVQDVAFERLTRNGNANLNPDIFPTNTEQDAWFLKMHLQSEQYNARSWFNNDFLESVYAKFETGLTAGGTFCRNCEESIFTLNADGKISGCANSATVFSYGTIYDPIDQVLNSPVRINNMACEKSRNPVCYTCDVFQLCGGDCHQLGWDGDVCGAPKSLMKHLAGIASPARKTWIIKDTRNHAY